ncbi:MAG: class I SAM-dependent methyltransferase [Theionarchaea archaeon]|nr:class I SAM-dependent methyltransferase [Theionarchaea archaeon]
MRHVMTALDFKLLELALTIRDLVSPPERKMKEAGLRSGFFVLDYGCGPGSYTISAARITGPSGRVYAVDVNPLALESVRKKAMKKRLSHVEVIHSNCKTGLESATIDVVLMYDVFHELDASRDVLEEMHRIMNSHGVMSLSDHHLSEEEILAGVCGDLFELARKGDYTYTFSRKQARSV